MALTESGGSKLTESGGSKLNQKYSYKDFTDKSFTDIPAEEFNNSEVVGSCFYQQANSDTVIFPDYMIGVTFSRCNLDNVHIPSGNTVIMAGPDKCCHRKIKVQNDLMDWILDDSLKPVEPAEKKLCVELGISTDPKDIPKKKMAVSIVEQKMKELKCI